MDKISRMMTETMTNTINFSSLFFFFVTSFFFFSLNPKPYRKTKDKKYFHHRLFREACMEVDGNLVKDLSVLGRDLSKTMIVDNSPHVFGYHVDNGIPIDSWYGDDKTDNELEKLEWFLRSQLVLEDEGKGNNHDVRNQIREKFQIHKLIENAKQHDLFEETARLESF